MIIIIKLNTGGNYITNIKIARPYSNKSDLLSLKSDNVLNTEPI